MAVAGLFWRRPWANTHPEATARSGRCQALGAGHGPALTQVLSHRSAVSGHGVAPTRGRPAERQSRDLWAPAIGPCTPGGGRSEWPSPGSLGADHGAGAYRGLDGRAAVAYPEAAAQSGHGAGVHPGLPHRGAVLGPLFTGHAVGAHSVAAAQSGRRRALWAPVMGPAHTRAAAQSGRFRALWAPAMGPALTLGWSRRAVVAGLSGRRPWGQCTPGGGRAVRLSPGSLGAGHGAGAHSGRPHKAVVAGPSGAGAHPGAAQSGRSRAL